MPTIDRTVPFAHTGHEDVPVPRDGTVESQPSQPDRRQGHHGPFCSEDPLVHQAQAAVAAEQDAHRVWQEALEARREAFRRAWPVIADEGPRAFARRVGVGESRVRAATVDLAARARSRRTN